MAKVTGPLYSITASGKIADAMVHFPWKGLNVVRQWLRPTQPNTEEQGDRRLIIGGLGRSGKAVESQSNFWDDTKSFAPAQQTWLSRLVQLISDNYMYNATAFEAEWTEFDAHSAQATFVSVAAARGLNAFDVTYKGTTHSFPAGLQLYMLAKAAILVHTLNATLFNREPYLTALASWDASEVNAMATDMTA